MISDRIRNIADRLAGCALHNQPFSPQECGALAHVLLAYAEQVERMENTWFAPETIGELVDYMSDTRDAA